MSGVEAPTGSGRVVGRYVLYDEIASGGMATIHIGRLLGEVGFARPVAIKRLLPHFARDAEFVSMFLEEARLAVRIRHRNVVPVLDVVRDDTENELFIVMEFIQGETVTRLTRVSRERSRIVPMPIALAIASDLLQGLHAAHEAKDESGRPLEIVHRDVSPHNVMVGNDGVSRVLDFGIAKASSSSQSTREGEVKGKFAYMSPEQLSSVPVDRRADIFAASIVLWEMLTASRLFQAPDPGAIVGKVLNGRIAPPSELAQGIPAQLDALVLKGLARDPNKRFATAADMARAIEELGIAIARPIEVGAWVNRIAGDALKKRARRLAEIESTGSFSAQNALRATAPVSQRPMIDDTGSASASRSGLRPRDPAASSSQQVAVPEPRSSRAGIFFFIALLAAGGGAGFVWRAKIAKLMQPPEPHGTPLTLPAPSAAIASTASVATAPSDTTMTTMPDAIDITSATPTAKARARFHAYRRGARPAQTAEPEPVETAAAPTQAAATGNVPQHPSLGTVQAALMPVMGSAKACFAPDSPPTRANVTFQSDGTVKSVGVTGFAAGKPQESCVKGMLSKAHVDPFSDASYSVPITIRP
ncbi:MAG TPA: serine/threonine-protein kinase [Polyangiaceae bacterium]|jgi:serine/threonine-protein kinase